MAPRWHTHQDRHINQRGEAHGESGQEQTLVRMPKHGCKDPGIEDVPQARYAEKYQEEHEVENEEYDGDDLQPTAVVRQLVEQDRYDSGAHRYDEPSAHVDFHECTIRDI